MKSYHFLQKTTLSALLLLSINAKAFANNPPPSTASSLSAMPPPTAAAPSLPPNTLLTPTTPLPEEANANNTPAPAAATAPSAVNPQSNAIAFAQQAGSIAGIVQACGENITIFTARVTEAINKLAINPTDRSAALLVYQQITRAAQSAVQTAQNKLPPCSKALEDYRKLPIMQADYETAVIAQLHP